MKAIDIIKPEPKTEFEAHERWKNRLHSELATLSYSRRKKIKVVQL